MRLHFSRVLGDDMVLSPVSAGTHVLGRTRSESRGGDDRPGDEDLRSMAAEEGLVVFPLSRYCVTPPPRDALVLGFGGLSPRRIATGAEKLASIVRRARRA